MYFSRLASVMVAALALAACGSGATTPTVAETPVELPADQILYGLKHTMTTNGVRRAELQGDTAYLFESGARIDLKGVQLVFFNDAGIQTGDLSSQTGEYQPRSGSMIARGNVILTSQGDGVQRRIETEELHFDVNGDQMWSDKPVVMQEGGTTVRGTSFRSDGRFRNVTVTRAQTTGASRGGGGISF